MWLYTATIFLSAFLLFQVQLVIAKYILPWHGGVPAVWTTCMLFFQCALLLGYAYVHWLDGRSPRAQRTIHLAVAALGLAALAAGAWSWGLPLLPDARWKPDGGGDPVLEIIELLSLTVILPFLTLSATTPLLQRWFAQSSGRRSPYHLYAVSNLGSLAGLVSYPFLVQVLIPIREQAWWWAAGYVAFTLGLAWIALRATAAPARAGRRAASRARRDRPAAGRHVLWFALAACASVLLLAITNQVSQEVAPVPLVWVLPLAVYLLSFVLCFESDRWYVRPIYLALLVPALALGTLLIQHGVTGDALLSQAAVYLAVLFVTCMVCHGELARDRPQPQYLTGFYLMVTAGGAAGGVFVGVVAPLLFDAYWEMSLGLWGCAALAVAVLLRDRGSMIFRGASGPVAGTLATTLLLAAIVLVEPLRAAVLAVARLEASAGQGALLVLAAATVMLSGLLFRPAIRWPEGIARRLLPDAGARSRRTATSRVAALALALAVFGILHIVFAHDALRSALAASRNFFGVLQVTVVADDRDDPVLLLRHGRTLHGQQSLAADRRLRPGGYYGPATGAGWALLNHPKRLAGEPMRIGVVGLGTGTLAAYGRPGDYLHFYEIDPAVIALAQGGHALFSYLRDSAATVDVVLGDARISMDRELGRGARHEFDVLVLDAFSSGTIPVHLLTGEAFGAYLGHLDPQGLLAVHISNHYLDLEPVVARAAEHHGIAATVVEVSSPDDEWSNRWMLLARSAAQLPPGRPLSRPRPGVPLWTDSYSNLLAVVSLSHARPEPASEGGKRPAGNPMDLER